MYLRLFLAGKQSGGYGYAAIQHRQREINQKHPFRDMYPQYWVSSIGGTYQDSRSFLSFRLVAGVALQWFPCRSRTGISISSPFYIAPLCSSGADRAAVFLRTGAGVNRRFPTVAGQAFPPDLLMAACCHHLRRQRPVQFRIPLRGKAWLDSRKIVKPGSTFLFVQYGHSDL